jgi:Flp pilus assembly protein TadG
MRVRGGASVTNLFPTQKQSLKRFGRADEGQALVLTALALVVLLLMAGLGVDVGYLRYQKQQMQKAADAGALAGATALAYNGNWNAAAVADVNANGFTTTKTDGTTNGVTITVNSPPKTAGDPFQNQSGYVEVIVSQPQPTFFMRVSNVYAVPVSARSVASAVGSGSGCIYVLAPSGSDTFDARGNIGLNSSCAIYINSSDSLPLDKKGGSGTIKANYIGIVGNEPQSDLTGVVSDLSSGQQPVTGIAPFTDPLSNVPPPTPELGCTQTNYSTNGSAALTPCTYYGGITIHGSGTVTFASGLYTLLGGGMTVDGGSTLSGNAVTFYNTYDSTHAYGGISIGGNVITNFSAPTDSSNGGVPGVLFFQDRGVPTTGAGSTFGGNSAQVYTGALYFPTTQITYNGTPSLSSMSTILVGWKLEFRGDATLNNYTLLSGGGGPIPGATLVE